MVGTSKILTVSYGTFSCTLEGFDEPFSTMKSIAEYFRDLAADDRYFGAEPPTPDAEMLHRIAEREIQRRVIARVDDTGVTLRQVDEDAPDEDEAPAAAAESPLRRRKDKSKARALALGERSEPEVTAPEPAPTAGEPVLPDSIAAKMMRIRAAVARSAATDAFIEDQHSETFFATKPISAAFSDIAEDDHAEPEPAATAEAAAPEADEVEDDRFEDEAVYAEAEAPDAAPPVAEDALSAMILRLQDAAGAVEDDLAAELDAEPYQAPEAPRAEPAQPPRLVRARVIKMRKPDRAESDAGEPADDSLPAMPNVLEAPVPTPAPAVTARVEADHDDLLDDTFEDEDEALADNLFDEDPAAIDWAAESAEDEDEDEDEDEENDDVETAPTLTGSTLSDDEEAELLAELAEVEREANEDRRTGRALRDVAYGNDDASVSRLLAETNSQLDDSEASRRRSTIAHLKAAVAATRADRDEGADEPEADERLDRFRDDLERVVRPRRPGEGRPTGTTRRLAPLMLVSEQRVDLPPMDQADAAASVRPRRITAGNLALMDDDDDLPDDLPADAKSGTLFADSTSFAEYAAKMGATDLQDLLEAAAAFAAYVEGRPHFSRPQLMKQVASFGDGQFTREDGLRSFGTLLRQGKIQKLKRGQFTISKASRFRPESFKG